MSRPIEQDDLLSLCEQGVQAALNAGADQAEVFASSHTESEVSLEKNDLNQTSRVEETTFGIRVIKGGALGFATSNQPDSLKEAAREAVQLADLSPADPLNGLPEGSTLEPASPAVDPALLAISVPELTGMCMDLLEKTRALDSRLNIDSGSISIAHGTQAVASSTGTRAAFESASAGGYLFGMCVDGDTVGSFSYDGDHVRKASELIPALEAAFARFAEKCVGALGPQKGDSFRGTVILPPETVQEFLVGNLMAVLGADSVRLGNSPLSQKVGETIASPLFNLVEEGAGLSAYRMAPFDREGTLRQRTPLISEGVLNGFLYNAYEARAAGKTSTGHASGGAASMPSVGSSCLSLGAGTTPVADLMKVDQGIFVTRFSGSTNPVTGDFSGVIKGGFLLRGGERIPVDETTMAGNLYDCLKNISAVSTERRIMNGSVAMPTLRIEDVSVTAG
jgi:PmbA protein